MDLAALKSINGLSRKSRVGAGHTLLVPRRDAGADATLLPVAIDRPAVEAEEKSVRLSHVVRKGETLMAISRKFNLPVADIKRWNRLQADTVRPGQTLAIETVVAEKSAPHRGVAAAKAGPAIKGRLVARGTVVKKSRVALHARGPVRIARR
jgi:LysM repeat protein